MFDTLFLLDLLRLFLLRSSGENKKNVHAISSAGLPLSVLCLRLFSTLCVFFFILYLMLGEQAGPDARLFLVCPSFFSVCWDPYTLFLPAGEGRTPSPVCSTGTP